MKTFNVEYEVKKSATLRIRAESEEQAKEIADRLASDLDEPDQDIEWCYDTENADVNMSPSSVSSLFNWDQQALQEWEAEREQKKLTHDCQGVQYRPKDEWDGE